MNNQLRIIYMGTPEFAVESLRRLVEGGYNVVGVVTMPDKPMGRHQDTLSQSAVKQYALSKGLPVLQPERLKDEAFLNELRSLRADLQVVVAFRMLPEAVWAMPRLGTFNLHASLLPQYRGAAPINWAVINGEAETGVTTFFLQHEIDTGNIIAQRRIAIGPDEDAGSVHDRLMELGGQLVVDTVDAIAAGTAAAVPQTPAEDGAALRTAPKIFKDTCRINWAQPARRIHDFVRGLSPYPAAWTTLRQGGKDAVLKVYRTRPLPQEEADTMVTATACGAGADGREGVHLVAEDGRLIALLTGGALELLEVQLAGKRRMPAADFLRGFRTDGSEMLL
ncbi:MAG: methionyl-tRNA formyltransferase [Alloprevotella sp.]|nr:methionyl-tRNA formyltransferase [Alloprevotella sp.]